MSRRGIYVLTLFLVSEAIIVNGRPPRFPTYQNKEVLEIARVVRSNGL